MTTLSADQIHQEGLTDWVLIVRALEARYETNGFAKGLELVERIGAAAEEAGHHPDLTLTWPTVLVRLWSHDARGVTERDVALARTISQIAAELGIAATPERTQNLELVPRRRRHQGGRPLLGGRAGLRLGRGAPRDRRPRRPDADRVVPADRGRTTQPRQRWHLDIHVDPAVADERIDAALAAGGTLVSDAEAPSFTILADAEGNKVCVCTWQSPTPRPDRRRPSIRDGDPGCWDACETRMTDLGPGGYRGAHAHDACTHPTRGLSRQPVSTSRHPSLPSRPRGFFM